jgi:hypothetical protein
MTQIQGLIYSRSDLVGPLNVGNRLPAMLEGMDAMDEELAARQRAAEQPVACSYELTPE